MRDSRKQDTFHRPQGRLTYSPRICAACKDAREQYWAAWHATEGPLEAIRVMSPQVCPDAETISAHGLNFEPALAAAPDGGVWCVWSQRGTRTWGLVARKRDDKWSQPIQVPTSADFAFHAAAACDGEGRLWVAHSAWDHGTQPTIAVSSFDGQEWSGQILFDDMPTPQMRPVLASAPDGGVWIAFCAYADGGFRVVTARLTAGGKAAGDVSSMPSQDETDQDLFPSLCIDAAGVPWVAWLTYADVLRDGVVGRQASMKCACWDGSAWVAPPGADGLFVNRLDWGMLPVETYWGYNGLRHRPQLARDENGMWVFWERHRTEHPVAGNVGNGQLCAKYNDGTGWSESKLVHNGHSCFLVSDLYPQPSDELVFACKLSPRDSDAVIDIAFLSSNRAQLEPLGEHPDELWRDWQRVSLPDEVTGPQSACAIERGSDTYELVWGDLHCHSYYSPDAEGEPLELLLYARDRGGLDFCCIIDNDYYPHVVMSRSAMDYLYAVAQSFDDTAFGAFWGYEYTYHEPEEGGRPKNHRAVVYYDRDQPIARRTDDDGRSSDDFLRTMSGSATLWHAHHEEWDLWGHPQEENVEVAAGWNDYMQQTDVSQRHLKAGFRFGFTGASDNHRICPGMGGAVTGLYVRHRSREGIIEALRRRRCFATTGCRLLLDFRVNDHLQGSELESVGAPRLRLSVRSAPDVAEIRVLRDEEIIARFEPETGDLDWYHTDEEAGAGLHRYRAEVRQVGEIKSFPHNIAQAAGHRAYSSPIWVTVLERKAP